jgi:hypothetical protein
VPHTTTPYFNSFPTLDAIAYGTDGQITRKVQIPMGQSKTVDVRLFSSEATNGMWSVGAYDYDDWVLGATPKLTLLLDKSEGRNGDTIQLTITPRTVDRAIAGEAFIIVSHYEELSFNSLRGRARGPGYQTNLTMSLVTN